MFNGRRVGEGILHGFERFRVQKCGWYLTAAGCLKDTYRQLIFGGLKQPVEIEVFAVCKDIGKVGHRSPWRVAE
ncbi:hypothetical protein GQ57_01270 [Burkholderia sp. MSh2]|nr:hypothetical protein GQ57_01270 [Burkholderia sp. MSh2]